MRKVACNFYTFKRFSLRNVMFGIASRNCSRTKSIQVHALHLEARYIGEHFQKIKKRGGGLFFQSYIVSILLHIGVCSELLKVTSCHN